MIQLFNEVQEQSELVVVSPEEAVLSGKFVGVVEELAPEVYHRAPYASQSYLNTAKRRSFRHAQWERENGSKSTPAKEFGTLFHMAILEPRRFAETYVCEPKLQDHPGALVTLSDLKQKAEQLGLPTSGTKEALSTRIVEKDPNALIWDWFLKTCARGKELLDPDWSYKIERMVESVLMHPEAEKLIRHSQAQTEVSAFAVDPETGVGIKARFDCVRFDLNMVGDVKTAECAEERTWLREADKYGYHRQSALYLAAYNLIMGTKTDMFVHIICEKEPPFESSILALGNASLEKGRLELQDLLIKYAHCLKTGVYPGYERGLRVVDLLYM